MREALEEAALRSGSGSPAIYGIPRSEWLKLQVGAG